METIGYIDLTQTPAQCDGDEIRENIFDAKGHHIIYMICTSDVTLSVYIAVPIREWETACDIAENYRRGSSCDDKSDALKKLWELKEKYRYGYIEDNDRIINMGESMPILFD